jgi:hypothetical protein
MELLFEEESYRILGACFDVYKEKGCGEGVSRLFPYFPWFWHPFPHSVSEWNI